MILPKSKVVNGPFSVSFTRSHNADRCWLLRVEDNVSTLRVLELTFTDEQFSSMMGNLHQSNIAGELLIHPNHGLKHEHRPALVPLPNGEIPGSDGWSAFVKYAEAYLEEHFPDWIPSAYDLKSCNHHRVTDRKKGPRSYEVHLHRWVEVEP